MEGHNGGAPLTFERPYDTQLSHAIWELERAIRRGGASESMRRTLVETHFQQIRYMEELADVPRGQRTTLQLQPRPGDTILLLPAEGAAADDLYGLAEHFFRRGWTVMAANLAYRVLGKDGYSPTYWQTAADEAANRFDVLAHFATRIAVLGVGMSGTVALHLATIRRVSEVVAVLPVFEGEPGFLSRLRATLRQLVLRRDPTIPREWSEQQRLAARSAATTAAANPVPLYLVVEDRGDGADRGRTAREAQKLAQRAATKVRVLRPNEASSVRDLSPSILDDILSFLRRR